MVAAVLVAYVEGLAEDVADGGIFLAELADALGDVVTDGGIVAGEGFGIDLLHAAGIVVEGDDGAHDGVADEEDGVLRIELRQLFVLELAAGHEDGGRGEVRSPRVGPRLERRQGCHDVGDAQSPGSRHELLGGTIAQSDDVDEVGVGVRRLVVDVSRLSITKSLHQRLGDGAFLGFPKAC